MDIRKLSEADRYMLYGLLLKKKRPPEAELRVLEIMRSPTGLVEKIDAILELQQEIPGGAVEKELALFRPSSDRRKLHALVIDPYPEVTKLLNKCSLRWSLEFTQAENWKQALAMVRRLKAKLAICNLALSPAEQARYFRECRSRQPRIKMIFLCAQPEECPEAGPEFKHDVRVVPKPINLDQVVEAARELLA